MAIDPTIRLDALIPLLGYLLGGFIFVIMMRADIKILAKDVAAQGKKIEALELIIVEQVRQDGRLLLMEKLLDDLRRGRGWIRHTARNTLDGEYEQES